MHVRDLALILVAVLLSFGGGYFVGKDDCELEVVTVPPVFHTDVDTVEVPPPWMLQLVDSMSKALAKKPRRDTTFLVQQVTVMDSFPYPVFVKDTSARFWWPERGIFGQKPGDVTTVVTREPFSGKATVLRYQTPGPILSFVADTSPRPRLEFGTFSIPKKHHGFLVDLLLVGGSFTLGSIGGTVVCKAS